MCSVAAVMSYSVNLQTVACQAPLSMGILQAKYWSEYHSLFQGIFPTQESKPGLLHCRQILYLLSHQRSPCYNCVCLSEECYCVVLVSLFHTFLLPNQLYQFFIFFPYFHYSLLCFLPKEIPFVTMSLPKT